MRSNQWFCSCGKRIWKVGDSYQRHLDDGEHDRRKAEQAKRKAERSREQRIRDGAADSMDVLGSGL